jgi:hypothetical protein
MPTDLEAVIKVQDCADLLAALRGPRRLELHHQRGMIRLIGFLEPSLTSSFRALAEHLGIEFGESARWSTLRDPGTVHHGKLRD